MEARGRIPVEDESDDDEEEVKHEVSETIEKFVQTRHVQTLKYLRHVIDENRHLRLHIEHLKHRANDPNPSPGVVDPIDPEDPPITEISLETPEVTVRLGEKLRLFSSRLAADRTRAVATGELSHNSDEYGCR